MKQHILALIMGIFIIVLHGCGGGQNVPQYGNLSEPELDANATRLCKNLSVMFGYMELTGVHRISLEDPGMASSKSPVIPPEILSYIEKKKWSGRSVSGWYTASGAVDGNMFIIKIRYVAGRQIFEMTVNATGREGHTASVAVRGSQGMDDLWSGDGSVTVSNGNNFSFSFDYDRISTIDGTGNVNFTNGKSMVANISVIYDAQSPHPAKPYLVTGECNMPAKSSTKKIHHWYSVLPWVSP